MTHSTMFLMMCFLLKNTQVHIHVFIRFSFPGLYLIERLVLQPQLRVRTIRLVIDEGDKSSVNVSVIEALLSLRQQREDRRYTANIPGKTPRESHQQPTLASTRIVLAASRMVTNAVLIQVT